MSECDNILYLVSAAENDPINKALATVGSSFSLITQFIKMY